MKTKLLALSICALTVVSAQTKASFGQVKDNPTPPTVGPRLAVFNPDGSSQTVTLGAGLTIVLVPGTQFPEIRATAAIPIPPAPPVVRYVNVKLVKQSDGTYAPVKPILGRLIVSTLEVKRNGITQDDTDFTFDGSNNSVRFIPTPGAIPPMPDDKIAMSVDAQQ